MAIPEEPEQVGILLGVGQWCFQNHSVRYDFDLLAIQSLGILRAASDR
jgi:hypothetical protein